MSFLPLSSNPHISINPFFNMPHNARCPAALQACTKTPTLRLSLPKLPVPEVLDNGEDPVNDEMKKQVDEKDIETQSEDS
ncbi:hypothetical protein BDBG_16503 [Blastomyces gilchristii SLH14081]|uniref:Uncharacterized protein n=1 Tax=Blastomyces gilchristii (strain SLH14081) TaxID=559298 RepID=A0A179UFS7_BLAGS|nr:uncharacterized protein BDBG_16503 [Blastomyces gilchristii SLH14081]OAT05861.1 hypothetical protein BDBG_16503 [Blastomyces gilchristii SLH14081]